MTKHHKQEETCCYCLADYLVWSLGWFEGVIVGCLMNCYVEEIVEPGLAEEMMMGAVHGFEDSTYVIYKAEHHKI
jgi:hypothetical protein